MDFVYQYYWLRATSSDLSEYLEEMLKEKALTPKRIEGLPENQGIAVAYRSYNEERGWPRFILFGNSEFKYADIELLIRGNKEQIDDFKKEVSQYTDFDVMKSTEVSFLSYSFRSQEPEDVSVLREWHKGLVSQLKVFEHMNSDVQIINHYSSSHMRDIMYYSGTIAGQVGDVLKAKALISGRIEFSYGNLTFP